MATANTQGVPSTNQPFVDPSKRITIAWYRLLITLWRRTGGALGNVAANVNPIGSFSNLNISCIDGLTVNINADQIVLTNDDGDNITFNNVVASCGVSGGQGINQLDANTQLVDGLPIYIFLISDGVSQIATIGSKNTSPLMPAGYSFKKMISVICASGTGGVRSFSQRGKTVEYLSAVADLSVGSITAVGVRQTYRIFIPPKVLMNFVASPQANASIGGWMYFLPTFGVPPAIDYTTAAMRVFSQVTFLAIGFNAVAQSYISSLMIDDQSSFSLIMGGNSVPMDTNLAVGVVGYEIPFI